ncbi:MAG: hypothetical protein QX199_11915 [Methylococcaceae bacterium]
MKIICKFNHFNQILLLSVLSSLHPTVAGSFGQPIITSALTDCEKYYLIQIFESGRVEYRGGWGVKTLGRRETQISQQALAALLKKFDEAGPITSDDREKLPSMNRIHGPTAAIRLRYGSRDLTFYGLGIRNSTYQPSKRPTLTWFQMLRQEIIHTTKADQWVTNPNRGICPEKHDIRINYLKIKQ